MAQMALKQENPPIGDDWAGLFVCAGFDNSFAGSCLLVCFVSQLTKANVDIRLSNRCFHPVVPLLCRNRERDRRTAISTRQTYVQEF